MTLVVVASLAISVAAAEPFVVLVDLERGLLLIPEGTVVPKGVEFSVGLDAATRSAMMIDGAEETGAPQQRFVYAYAPAEQFVEARQRIAAAEATMPEAMKVDDLGPMSISNFDQTYYYTFWDGSYHAIRKVIWNSPPGVEYAAWGWVYSAAGEWDTKVYVKNSCPQTQYPNWNQSKTCWFYNEDGTCLPTFWTYWTWDPVVATVTSTAALTRYLYPPCSLPCKSNSSSTLSVSFP